MKGLILTYLLAYGGAVIALFYPVVGLCVYVAFSMARPQVLYGWAGDMSGLSRVIGAGLVIGWAVQGVRQLDVLAERRLPIAFSASTSCGSCLSATVCSQPGRGLGFGDSSSSSSSSPFLAGITLIRSRGEVTALAWTIVLAQGLVGFEMNLSYLQRLQPGPAR